MKNVIYCCVLCFLWSCGSTPSDTQTNEWITIFNGKDLTGWNMKIKGFELGQNYKNTFRVEDGLLKVSYDEYDKFYGEYGHLFYKDKFSHYRLRLEYRFLGEQVEGGAGWAYRNSGVMFHAQSPETMAIDQPFPVSLEAQFLGGSGEGERPTGNLCTPGMNVVMADTLVEQHCIQSSSKTYHGDQWVTAELVVHGDSLIQHLINGEVVISYSKPQIGGGSLPEDYPLAQGAPVKEGYFALQAESHPLEFRKIELMDLSKKK